MTVSRRPTPRSTTSPSHPAANIGPSGTFSTDMSVTVNDQGGGGRAGACWRRDHFHDNTE